MKKFAFFNLWSLFSAVFFICCCCCLVITPLSIAATANDAGTQVVEKALTVIEANGGSGLKIPTVALGNEFTNTVKWIASQKSPDFRVDEACAAIRTSENQNIYLLADVYPDAFAMSFSGHIAANNIGGLVLKNPNIVSQACQSNHKEQYTIGAGNIM